MTTIGSTAGVSTPPQATPQERLRQSALQMEGIFVQQLFAAMRDTVPQDGIVQASSAQDTFTSLFDEKLAQQVPTQWSGSHSLAEALYRQLSQRLAPAAADPHASDSSK
ncbi:MAG TPA: rod-binding protein [Gemmatimonadaceae bacterium]|nr:rod-binding protein [Gemmatimonadaceae bacterium]